MPFNPQATYMGGQYLQQGLTSAGVSIGDALKQYQEDKAKVGMADTVVHYAQANHPGSIAPEDLQRYASANAKEKAFIAMGVQSNLADMFKQAAYRKDLAEGNYYTAHGAAVAAPQGPAVTSIPDPNNPGRTINVLHGGTPLPGQEGIPGSVQYDANKKAIGFYDAAGKYHPYQSQGPDIMSLFGVGGGGATDQTAAAQSPPATPGATGPQPTDVAVPVPQGAPGNTPSYLLQQPPQQQAAAPAARGGARGGPQLNEVRIIQGQRAYWDGTGWRAAGG